LVEENKKTMPKDMDSDYSLPGRLEESNFEYLDTTTKDKPNSKILILCVVSFAIVSAAFFSYYFINQNEIDSEIMQQTTNMSIEDKLAVFYQVGERGSEHSHAAIVVFVDEEMLNFGLSKFQLSSKYIHFENDDPHIIHKHATNVPLEMLFSSFGMKITSNCIILDQGDAPETKISTYCTKKDQIFSVYVNGEEYNSDITQYVLKHNDRIMITMGDEKLVSKQLKYLESIEIFDTPKKIPQNSGRDINL
jgi:hypothetical protein